MNDEHGYDASKDAERLKAYLGVDRLGGVSDGYHTFDELYHHRAVLTSLICNQNPDRCWKSRNHHPDDDPMYDGMFIVGISTPFGQATYHYDLDPYWDLFHIVEKEYSPKWDGHTPDEAIDRLMKWSMEA